LNGLSITATDVEMYPVFLGLAAGTVSEQELVAWLKANTRESE
jgi:prophage maintenance system killer protein